MPNKLLSGLFAALCCGQSPSTFNSHELLLQAISQISSNSDTLPRFTCLETVERSFYVQPHRQLSWTDRYRLAVGIFDGHELFSWPGDEKFQYEWPDALIGGGASTAGEFGPFAVNVFMAETALQSFEFKQLSTIDGTEVADYLYSVPYDQSHFLIKIGPAKSQATAFQGTFSIDLKTHDLRRLVVTIDHPPSISGIQQGRIETDYSRVVFGTTSLLLPQTSKTSLTTETGDLSVNQSRYTNCKEFAAESSVNFKDIDPASTSARSDRVTMTSLPAGLRLAVKLTTPIDSNKSFAGDPVNAEIANDVKLGHRILVPAHTHLLGKIVSLRRQFYPEQGVTLSILFDHIETDGVQIPVSIGAIAPPVEMPVALPMPQNTDDLSNRHLATIAAYGTNHLILNTTNRWYFKTAALKVQ